MGFLNKVKNLFFEEEEIEIEDEVEEVKKEKPVAKKIELPKVVKKEKEEIKEEIYEEPEVKTEEVKKVPEKENKFPMDFDEDDFKEERFREVKEKKKEVEQPKRREKKLYQGTSEVTDEVKTPPKEEIKYDFEKEYGKEKPEETHGLYEGKATKKVFTPTPIISPIYGILDKNYKKEDVVTKKEVHLSSVTPKKVDLDTVREKAYGDLTNDISETMDNKKKDYEEDIVDFDSGEEENILFDLNDEKSQPEVKRVTVGDAEEYFNELGLEYNIDYKDTSIEKSKKETKKRRDDGDEEKDEVVDKTKEDEKDKQEDNEELESNLFDLIDSMYEEKE